MRRAVTARAKKPGTIRGSTPSVGSANLANPKTKDYNNNSVTHVVGQSVTHVPVRTVGKTMKGKGRGKGSGMVY